MRTTTSKLLTALLLTLGLGGMAGSALARGPMGGGDCGFERGGYSAERRAQHMEQRQQKLHDALKLNADQEVAWKKFNESLPAAKRDDARPGDWQGLNAPQRAEKMLEFSKQRQEGMAAHVAALKTFYATLTPEQQKIYDGFHMGPRGERGGRRGPPTEAPAPAPAAK
ncbi:MAG TPA: Spy/CpxP family protein refolding chaperone [Rhodocyclaceae bacterium]|nr:Spy/CpxP family protein refolding chaperone [Rhodocyclaceae bacterium]